MDEFDKEFDNSPEAFDDEFEAAEAVEPSLLSKLAQKGGSALEGSKSALEGILSGIKGAGVGAAEGMLGGGLSELTGLVSAGAEQAFDPSKQQELEAQGFKFPGQPSTFGEKYRAEEQAAQELIEEATEEAPVLSTLGQLGGAVASGSALGRLAGMGQTAKKGQALGDILKTQGIPGAAKELGKRGITEYAKAVPLLAAEGALSSEEGGLIGATPEEQQKLGADVMGSLAFGLPAVMGLTAAGDVIPEVAKKGKQLVKETVEDSPLLRQMGLSYEYGKKGINPGSKTQRLKTELGEESLAQIDTTRTQGLVNEIFEADKKLGTLVGKSLDDATANGVQVQLNDILSDKNILDKLQQSYQTFPEVLEEGIATGNARADAILSKIIENRDAQLSPREAKSLLDDINSFIGKFEASRARTTIEENTMNTLKKLGRNISLRLKEQIPEYKQAASRFEEFRRLVPETIISGHTPVDVSEVYMKDLRKAPEKLFNALEKQVKQVSKEGSSSHEVENAFVNTIKGMKQFETNEALRGVQESVMPRSASEYEKMIKHYSDDAMARQMADTLEQRTSLPKSVAAGALNVGEAGRSKAIAGANVMGRVSKSEPGQALAKMSRAVYNAPSEKLVQFGSKLENSGVPGLSTYGKALREAIEQGDSYKKNSVLFTIMQNPESRAFISADDFDETEE